MSTVAIETLDPLPKAQSSRYHSLDLWRGSACLLVLIFHAVVHSVGYHSDSQLSGGTLAGTISWLVKIALRLHIGVPMFFVISGYCITAAVDSSRRRKQSIRVYFARRFRRIYPPFWIVVILSGLCAALLYGLVPPRPSAEIPGLPRPWHLTGWQWFGNLTLTESWRMNVMGGPKAYFLLPAWTLCYEEQFYALSGLLLFIAPRRYFTAIAVLTGLTVVAQSVIPRLGISCDGFFFDGHWLMFAAGILVYYRINYCSAAQGKVAHAVLLLAAIWVILRHAVDLTVVFDNVYQHMVVAFLFALLISFLYPYDLRLASARVLQPLLLCGLMCYSLYLIQWVIVRGGIYLSLRCHVEGVYEQLLVVAPACVIVSLAAAWGYHLAVERRFIPGYQKGSTRHTQVMPVPFGVEEARQ